MKFDENIAFHHVNDYTILSFSYLQALKVGTYQTPPSHTYLLVISMTNPPFGHCDVRMKKMQVLHFY
jgi:hypothetical protein